MKSNTLKNNTEPHLKLIKTKSPKRAVKSNAKRIYINTLIPGFSYINESGKKIVKNNCALL